jgi:phosphate transport system substrate-binding protein
MNIGRWAGTLAIAALSFLGTSCMDGDDVTIQGAGATFPAPLYKRWFLEYYQRHPNVRVNYQAIGSGAGIRKFNEDLTQFGATDGFPSKEEMEAAPHGMIPLPMTAGSVAICYNATGVPNGLKLSRDTYVDIFLGRIRHWRHQAIQDDNPGLALPDEDITVVRRAESSGTTYAFTNHLNFISPKWQANKQDPSKGGPGKGKSVTWPKGFLGGKGNAGVAALIQQTPGAIGYLEFGYADLAKLNMAQLQNKAGAFVAPSAASGTASLTGPNLKAVPKNLKIELPDPEGEQAYPIVTYTWLLVQKRYKNARVGEAVKDVLEYCLTEGQKIAPELGYLAMPPEVIEEVRARVKTIEVGK